MTAVEDRIRRSFELLDERSADSAIVRVLRRRLVGELFGDGEQVSSALDPGFELVMHAGGAVTTMSGSDLAESMARQGAARVLLWVELTDLIVAADRLAGHGALVNLALGDGALASTPIAFFVGFAHDLMVSEVAFMDTASAQSSTVPSGQRPSSDRLRQLVDRPPSH